MLTSLLRVLPACRPRVVPHYQGAQRESAQRDSHCAQAFELMGVVARGTLLRLLRARIGLVPMPVDGQQVG